MYYRNRDTSSESHKHPGLPHHQHASPPWTASQPASVVANRSMHQKDMKPHPDSVIVICVVGGSLRCTFCGGLRSHLLVRRLDRL